MVISATSSRPRRWVRRGAAVASAAALVIALAACSPGKSDPGSTTASGGSTVNLGLIGSVNDSVYPYVSQSTVGEGAIDQNVFDTLTDLDSKGKLQMALAQSFTHNADNTVWTVHLRPNVKLHNGGTFGADDVIYSVQQMFDRAKTFGAITQISSFVDPKQIKKINDLTVQFTLKEPYGVFPSAWSYSSLPMIGKDSTEKDPDGTGPFTVTSFVANRQATLKRFDRYWGQKPGFKNLDIYFFQDDQSIVNALQSGQIDLTTTVPYANVATLKSSGIEFVKSNSATHLSFDMRTDIPPFNNKLVREALALSINREQIVKTAYAGFATLGNDYDGGTTCPAPDVPQRKQDIAKAKQLLQQAGDPKITVNLATDGVFQGMTAAGQLISQDAAEIGMNVKFDKMDTGTLLNKWLQWPFVINVMTSDYLSGVPDHSLPGGQDNASHWNNAQFNTLAKQLFNTPDPNAQCPIIQTMQAVQHDDVPSLIVAYPIDLTPHSARIRGLQPDLFGRTAYTFGGVTVG